MDGLKKAFANFNQNTEKSKQALSDKKNKLGTSKKKHEKEIEKYTIKKSEKEDKKQQKELKKEKKQQKELKKEGEKESSKKKQNFSIKVIRIYKK